MKHYIYLRVSTSDQSVETQRAECMKYLLDRGIKNYQFYADEGYSGTLSWEDRPSMATILDECKKGDVILVFSRDRLGRDVNETTFIKCLIRQRGASVVSVTQPTEGLDEIQEMLFNTIYDVVAHIERFNLLSRTKAGLKLAKSKGRMVGRVPYGYSCFTHPTEITNTGKIAKYIVPNPEEQLILAEMIRMYDEGAYYRVIQQTLNDKRMFNRDGRPWQQTSIRIILQNREKHLNYLKTRTAFPEHAPQF